MLSTMLSFACFIRIHFEFCLLRQNTKKTKHKNKTQEKNCFEQLLSNLKKVLFEVNFEIITNSHLLITITHKLLNFKLAIKFSIYKWQNININLLVIYS